MPIVTTRFATSDPYIFVVGSFTYDPERGHHWNVYLNKIERALSGALEHMLRTYATPQWETVREALSEVPFVTKSEPGSCACRIDGSDVQYDYAILYGTYNSTLTLSEVRNHGHDRSADIEVCYPFS